MPEGSGFAGVGPYKMRAAIFVTAFDQYAAPDHTPGEREAVA